MKYILCYKVIRNIRFLLQTFIMIKTILCEKYSVYN